MKKTNFYIGIMLLALTCASCSKGVDKQELNAKGYVSETDDHTYVDDGKRFVESDKGAYYWKDGLLYYYDLASDKETLLCRNANCEHTGQSCNAMFMDYDEGVYYYKDSLYMIEMQNAEESTKYYLAKVSEDGSVRTRMTELFEVPVKEAVSYVGMIHRGYFYFSVSPSVYDKKKENVLYRVQIKENAKVETIASATGYGVEYEMQGYGTKIYFDETQNTDANASGYSNQLKTYDITNGKIEECGISDFRRFLVVDGDVYYNAKDTIWKKTDGKKPEKFYDLGRDMIGNFKYDGKYFYFDNLADYQLKEKDDKNRTILVIDKNGSLINKLKVSSELEMYGGDKERMFFYNYKDITKVYLQWTNKFGDGQLNPEELK